MSIEDEVDAQVEAFRQRLATATVRDIESAQSSAIRLIEDEDIGRLLYSFIRGRLEQDAPHPSDEERVRLVRKVEDARIVETFVSIALKEKAWIDLDGDELVLRRMDEDESYGESDVETEPEEGL